MSDADTLTGARLSAETVQGLLIAGANRWSDRPFVYHPDGSMWTRGRVFQEALSAASALRRWGVRPGEHVSIILPNGPEWLRAWWGAAVLGAIVLPVNPNLKGRVLGELFETTRPSYIIASAVPEGLPPGSHLILPSSLSAPTENVGPLPAVTPDDAHMIVFTSGTTGRSKGSLTSNLHLCNQSFWMVEGAGISEHDRALVDLPLCHMAALGMCALMMRVGGSIALRERPSLSRYWEVAKEAGTTYGYLVSSMAAKLVQNEPSPAECDHKMRFFLSSPLPPDAEAFIERFELEGLCTAFGSTETSTVIAKGLRTPLRAGSCGTVRQGFDLRIVDDCGNDVPNGQRGELLVRSHRRAATSLGYYNNDSANAEAWRDGWYHTGDIFECDNDGYYYWKDRLKESIRRRGENISSQEVEREILAFPGVSEAACVAVAGELKGDEEIKAFLVTNMNVNLAELVQFLTERLPYFMVPRFYEVIPELPKTATMKIQKYVLRLRDLGSQTWDREKAPVGDETANS
jgi:carnitine-CoA ligase